MCKSKLIKKIAYWREGETTNLFHQLYYQLISKAESLDNVNWQNFSESSSQGTAADIT